jgi:mannose-1-phosphate guanylyltransferase
MASGILTAMTIKRHFMLSGGSSTRLWPFSCSMYPEQFLKFFCGETMLQQTGSRLDDPRFDQSALNLRFLVGG